MKEVELITNHKPEFLKYLKSKFPLYHMSNIFFRDIHFGVLSYLQSQGKKVGYVEAEMIVRQVAAEYEKDGVFKKIDHQSWLLNYPEYMLPRVEKKAS